MEKWKTIKDFDRYEVSNLGRVRSKDFYRINKRFQNGVEQEYKVYYPGKLLKPDISRFNNSNYFRVTLSKDNKQKRFLVHRLVAQAFIPNPNNLPHINHIDNDGTNNKVSNLEWCTHSENMIHAQKQGRLFKSQSKAGTIAGIKAKENVKKKITSLKGLRINNWTVLDEFDQKNKKYRVKCQCDCGTIFWHNLSRIVNNELGQCCASCRKKR